MTMQIFETAKDLKIDTRDYTGCNPLFKRSDITEINGYKFNKIITPRITNRHVTVYDIEKQDNVSFPLPFTVTYK